MLISAMVKVQN